MAKNRREETDQRLAAILKGAFAGPPKPLKEIPTRDGSTRADPSQQPKRRRLARQRKKRAA